MSITATVQSELPKPQQSEFLVEDLPVKKYLRKFLQQEELVTEFPQLDVSDLLPETQQFQQKTLKQRQIPEQHGDLPQKQDISKKR